MGFAQVGHSTPYNNINGSLVNIDNSQFSGSAFTSRVIPSTVNPAVLPEPLSNRQAAASYIPGCTKGGTKKGNNSRNLKYKFKNISNMYRMKGSKKYSLSKLKRKLLGKTKRNKTSKRKTRKGSKRSGSKRSGSKRSGSKRSKRQRGGYSQYENNLPMTQTYSLGGPLSANNSALASPPPYQVLSNCTNCVDNYSRFTNNGFPSRGSY
jgi:hypothetical protein